MRVRELLALGGGCLFFFVSFGISCLMSAVVVCRRPCRLVCVRCELCRARQHLYFNSLFSVERFTSTCICEIPDIFMLNDSHSNNRKSTHLSNTQTAIAGYNLRIAR